MHLIIEKARIADLYGTYFQQGHIVIQNGLIKSVASGAAPEVPEARILDAGGRLVTPGLINAHSHLYSTLARGMPLSDFNPSDFRSILEGLWWRLDKAHDKESIHTSAMLGSLAHLRRGVTTVFDHHASPNTVEGSLSFIRQGVEEVGLRAALSYEVTDRGTTEQRDAGIAENVRFAQEVAESGQFAAHMGLHASFTLEDASLEQAASAAEPLGLGFHMHLAEGKDDPVHALQNHAVRTTQRLDRFGILRPGSLLAHGVHLSVEETELLAEKGPTVVHNPRSNMNNAVGAPKVDRMLARGIPMAIGTDGLGCGIFTEVFCARLLAHHAESNPVVLGDEALLSLLRHNYTLAEELFGMPLGRIGPGNAADLVIWDYVPPTPLDTENLLTHLMFADISEGLHPFTVLAQGNLALWEGKVQRLDEQAALARGQQVAQDLWARI